MARPPKSGLEYFPLDVDMDSDEKVAYVISRYGFESFGLLVKLLMETYRNGYYLVWNERQKYLLSHRLGIEPGYAADVVTACVGEDIFCMSLYNRYEILTSHGIQRRYVQAAGRRTGGAKMIKDLCLLDETEIAGARIVFVNRNTISADNNHIFANGNEDIVKSNSGVKKTKTSISENKNEVSDDKNDGSCQQQEKEFLQQENDDNRVSDDKNDGSCGIFKNEKIPKQVFADKNEVSDDKNGVYVVNPSTEMPQRKGEYKSSSCSSDDDKKADEEFSEIATLFSDNIHPVSGEIERDMLLDYYNEYGKKWVLEAIKEAALRHGRSVKYIGGILSQWKDHGFKVPPKPGKEAAKRGSTGRNIRKSTEAARPSDYAEAERNQKHPWDVQPDAGIAGTQPGAHIAG